MNSQSIAPFIQEYYPQYYSIESYPAAQCVTIRKVAEEWGLFCNFARTPIVLDGVTFKSSELLFQLMKFQEEEPIRAVSQANNPKMTAKKWQKTHRRPDWGSMIVDAMKFCLQQKYEQNENFRQLLEESGDKFIVEDQTYFRKRMRTHGARNFVKTIIRDLTCWDACSWSFAKTKDWIIICLPMH